MVQASCKRKGGHARESVELWDLGVSAAHVARRTNTKSILPLETRGSKLLRPPHDVSQCLQLLVTIFILAVAVRPYSRNPDFRNVVMTPASSFQTMSRKSFAFWCDRYVLAYTFNTFKLLRRSHNVECLVLKRLLPSTFVTPTVHLSLCAQNVSCRPYTHTGLDCATSPSVEDVEDSG